MDAPVPIPIEAALARVAAEVRPLAAQAVALEHALGRTLAQDLTAPAELPAFASSAMDGFALRAADSPGTVTVVGESAAGAPFPGTLPPGAAVVISTGAVVPPEADAVVPLERARRDGETLTVAEPLAPETNIRRPGSDVHGGQRMLSAGTRIGSAQIGAAAAAGLGTLPCHRAPSVAIVGTGSELRPPGTELALGEIYDSNGPMLRALLRTAGAQAVTLPTAVDTPAAHREGLERALEHDVVITTGGVSVGGHDLVRASGAALGVREVFWRVRLRPGKPMWFGVRGETLVFGLPGNPVSVLACFELFVRPALVALQGGAFGASFDRGVLAEPVACNPERDGLIRVTAEGAGWNPERPTDIGARRLRPAPGQQSHQIVVTAGADGLARIPAGCGLLPAGTAVAFLPFR